MSRRYEKTKLCTADGVRFLMTLAPAKYQRLAEMADREKKSKSLIINELIDEGLKQRKGMSISG